MELGVRLGGLLSPEALGHVRPVRSKPGGVEDLQVEGLDGGSIAAGECVASQENRQGPAAGQCRDLADDPIQGHRVAIVSIDGLKTGGATGGVVGLGQDLEVKAGLKGRSGPWLRKVHRPSPSSARSGPELMVNHPDPAQVDERKSLPEWFPCRGPRCEPERWPPDPPAGRPRHGNDTSAGCRRARMRSPHWLTASFPALSRRGDGGKTA